MNHHLALFSVFLAHLMLCLSTASLAVGIPATVRFAQSEQHDRLAQMAVFVLWPVLSAIVWLITALSLAKDALNTHRLMRQLEKQDTELANVVKVSGQSAHGSTSSPPSSSYERTALDHRIRELELELLEAEYKIRVEREEFARRRVREHIDGMSIKSDRPVVIVPVHDRFPGHMVAIRDSYAGHPRPAPCQYHETPESEEGDISGASTPYRNSVELPDPLR